jgi:hypothetical protein
LTTVQGLNVSEAGSMAGVHRGMRETGVST